MQAGQTPTPRPDRATSYAALESAISDVCASYGWMDDDGFLGDWVFTVAITPMRSSGRTRYVNLMSQEGHLAPHVAQGLAGIGSDMIQESNSEYE